jgi:hypothetical protein
MKKRGKKKRGRYLTQNNRIRRKNRKIRMQLVEEMQLLGCRADAVCEEEHVAFQPGDFLGGEFVAGAGS